MTSKTDLRRLGSSLGVLGTLLEDKGEQAWNTMDGWQHGPRKAPQSGERGGGGGDADLEDRKFESIQRARAARHFTEFRTDLDQLDTLVQSIIRRMDVACPPNIAEITNRKTGELDPVTPGDVAAAGWCASCWRNDQQMVVREKQKKSGLYYSSTLCRWCLNVKRTYGIEPPVEMLKLHHAGRRISVQAMEEAIAAALPKAKGKKQKKGKRAKAA